MRRSSRDAARQLSTLAHGQGGYFTAKQAHQFGYEYPHLDYHVSSGNFERVDHGLYRMVSIPPVQEDELIRWTLWSRNQKDEPQAVASHETALVIHGLSELLPTKLHFTVPLGFRKVTPTGCVLHKANLSKQDWEERSGFRVTTPIRTLIDAATNGVSREQVEKAVDDCLENGLISRSQLGKALDFFPAWMGLKMESDKKRLKRL